ncbi:tripartite motif-containing protein 3-like [Patiria miniata]|uniref:Uncharacterized protein n=1 Tax=Patiria miniata TaxID=46514 RepID=A0A914BFA1_PATMI|nr:tripartite motif-containing protein 3-like [Patiria miniata]
MAEGGVTNLVLDETQKELQECPICYTEYKDARMLDCSHSFCLKCLQELKLTQNKDDKSIVCPLCRSETALTEAGLDMLPEGSKDVNQQEQTEGQGLKVMCQACDEENEAISRCVDCKHYLCQECLKAHNRLASLRAHKIVDLTELPVESQDITEETELKKVPKCHEHPDQDLCLYSSGKILGEVNEVMTTATCYEILKSKKKILRDLNEQVEVHKSLDIKHGKSFLGFKESKEDGQLGTLLLEEKWEKCDTFSLSVFCATHLAAYSTSEMVMLCSEKLLTLDPEGKEISTKTYKPDPDKPNEPHDPNDIQKATALAINKDDQLLILDNPAVKIFNKEYQLLHQFLPGKEAGLDSTPTCLAVDSSNLIAVGYKDKDQISLHNPDGSLVRTLPAPMIDTYLKFSNKQLIYTNNKEGLLMAVDFHGNKLFNQSCSDPRGLCCDDTEGTVYQIKCAGGMQSV